MTSDLKRFIEEIRSKEDPSKSVVFVSGNFNIIHPGHLRLLEFAYDCGDILVVAVNPDEAEGVMFPQDIRAEAIMSLSKVDHVIKLDGDLSGFIKALEPDVVVKGKEHQEKQNLEADAVKAYGGKLLFGSGARKYTSIELLNKEYENISYCNIHQPHEYLDRHEIMLEEVKDILLKMKQLNVLVVGDTIVDEYITCDTLGLSQEDPTIVVTPILSKRFIGGAGIVASHARGFGRSVKFFSVVAEDEAGEYAARSLKEYNVDARLFKDKSRPTSLKQRFRTKDKTLLRVSHLRQHSISEELCNDIYGSIEKQISNMDLLVFSDFNYGCLPQSLVDRICILCRSHGVKMVADSQSSSQIGDISRFTKMDLITPTEREARLAVRDFESGLVVLTEKLRKKAQAKNIFVTMGAEGVLVVDNQNSTDRLAPLNLSPRDVSGAGDSMLVSASMAMVSGASVWQASYIGAVAAAIQVSRLGNIPLSTDDLLKEIHV